MEWKVIPPMNNTKITLELRELVENGVDLWNFEYPSYYTGDEKTAFERKVIDHYYFRQIGQETVGRFLHYFRARIREIMPYYIQRYKSCEWLDKIEDPLESYNLTEEYKATHSNTGTTSANDTGTVNGSTSATLTGKVTEKNDTTKTIDGENTDSGTDTQEFSDTPQGNVGETVDTGYLTNFTRNTKSNAHTDSVTEIGAEDRDTTTNNTTNGTNNTTTENTSSGSTSDTGENTYTLTRRGNIGVQPLGGEINNIREAFLNVDMEIIDELRDLFLMVY